jgi:hypothetical protein
MMGEAVTALNITAMPSQAATTLATDYFTNTGHEILRVKNTNVASTTVTLNSTENCVFGNDHNISQVCAQNQTYDFPILPLGRFGSTVIVTYSANYADMLVDVIKVL